MNKRQEPKRWREQGAPAWIQQAYEEHSALGPDQRTLGGMLALLQASTAGNVDTPHYDAAPSASATSVSPAGHSLTIKLGTTLLIATLALGAAWWQYDRAHSRPHAVVSVPSRAIVPKPQLAIDVRPAPVEAQTVGVPTPILPTKVRRKPVREPASSKSMAPETLSVQTGGLPEELALLRRARRALAHDPAATLRLSAEHAAAFPHGAFLEEREVLAIEALVALERRGEAELRAKAFRSSHPLSLHLRRLEVVLAKSH